MCEVIAFDRKKQYNTSLEPRMSMVRKEALNYMNKQEFLQMAQECFSSSQTDTGAWRVFKQWIENDFPEDQQFSILTETHFMPYIHMKYHRLKTADGKLLGITATPGDVNSPS